PSSSLVLFTTTRMRLSTLLPYATLFRSRGIFILDAAALDEARALVATDPVIAHGEMVAELHAWYGSAALRQVNATHARIARRSPDRKSTRLNSSHVKSSYAASCLKKKIG